MGRFKPAPARLAIIDDVADFTLTSKKVRYGRKHREYPRGVQVLMDLLVANNLSVADTAKRLKLSTGALSKVITADNDLLSEVNGQRQTKGMRPLRKR